MSFMFRGVENFNEDISNREYILKKIFFYSIDIKFISMIPFVYIEVWEKNSLISYLYMILMSFL